ncbi:hypothetical protein PoB_005070900 [Plakobranchus ocellatus]|uniref:Uncharacterized protein n=1 Tax=Plakobranchus ocellatus TaxID=259542 RepID=A0AAV4BZA1_9GAST|nr:hypothetical protein PoB_005070900 [Plakobranchus ocellatus]
MVNVATRAQSKRATTEVPAGPQEVLPKSLVDSGLTPGLVMVSTATPPQILSQPGNIIDSPCTPAAKTVTSNGSQLYPSEEDILSLYLDFTEQQRADPTLTYCFGRLIRILFMAFRMSLTMVTYIVSSNTQVILTLLRHFVFLNLLDLKYCNQLMKPTFQVTLNGVKPWPL